MNYYRISDGTVHDLTLERYAQLQANGKASGLRLFVVDAQPLFDPATQVVESAGIVIGLVEAHQTWAVRAMTAAEIERADPQAEVQQLDLLISDVKTQLDIDNATFNVATTAAKFDILRADRRLLLRAARFLLRRVRRGL